MKDPRASGKGVCFLTCAVAWFPQHWARQQVSEQFLGHPRSPARGHSTGLLCLGASAALQLGSSMAYLRQFCLLACRRRACVVLSQGPDGLGGFSAIPPVNLVSSWERTGVGAQAGSPAVLSAVQSVRLLDSAITVGERSGCLLPVTPPAGMPLLSAGRLISLWI